MILNVIYTSLYDFLKKIFIYLFIYLWLHWVFVAVRGLSPAAASGGHSAVVCGPLIVVASPVADNGF